MHIAHNDFVYIQYVSIDNIWACVYTNAMWIYIIKEVC